MAGVIPERALWARPVVLRRVRQLSLDGRVVVGERAVVKASDLVARGLRPALPVVVPVARLLQLGEPSLDRYMARHHGETIRQGELLAHKRGFVGLGSRSCRSPVAGTVQMGSPGTGEVLVVPPPEEVELRAQFPGTVVSILPLHGVVIELTAVGLQGIVGIPGETGGRIRVLSGPDQEIPSTRLTERLSGAVVVGGSIGLAALRRAAEVGVHGVVVGSLRASAYQRFVADNHDLPLIVTEGFGTSGMPEQVFEVLRQSEGRDARLQGGGTDGEPPEVLIPADDNTATRAKPPSLALGSMVRIVAGRHAFSLGQVSAVGGHPMRFPSGVVSRWIEVRLADGTAARVPVANVELLGF
jgi:hypothetical protein